MYIRQHDILATKIEWQRIAQHFSDTYADLSLRIIGAVKSSSYRSLPFSVVLNHREFALIRLWYQELTHVESARFPS